jgi:hypothetical protein
MASRPSHPYRSVVLAVCLLLVSGCAHAPRAVRPSADRTLLIALDGVPYEVVREMRNEGRFAAFQPPSRVISPFPSTTPCGFGGLFRPMGASPPMGYDREYYSYKEEKIVGFLSSINPKNKRDFKNVFDYSRKTPLQKFWIYAAPGLSGRRDLEKIRRLVWKTDTPSLLTYIGGTDGAGHVLGRKRLKHWLAFLDDRLERMRRDYRRDFGGELHYVLFSDHGFHYFRKPNAVPKADISRALYSAGLKFAPDLKRPENVVAIQWGNISGASFYARQERVPEVALMLAHTRGIDIVAYREGGDIEVLSDREGRLQRARVTCDARRLRCRYIQEDGDPLNYAPVVDALRRKGRMDARGFAASQDWFDATQDHFYPDALYRMHDGFFTLVENPAPILFSTGEDYEYGDVFTRIGAWFHGGLKGTHGGLFQAASAAFVMPTDPRLKLPPVMRYDQVMPRIFNCRDSVSCMLPRFAHVDTPPPVP